MLLHCLLVWQQSGRVSRLRRLAHYYYILYTKHAPGGFAPPPPTAEINHI